MSFFLKIIYIYIIECLKINWIFFILKWIKNYFLLLISNFTIWANFKFHYQFDNYLYNCRIRNLQIQQAPYSNKSFAIKFYFSSHMSKPDFTYRNLHGCPLYSTNILIEVKNIERKTFLNWIYPIIGCQTYFNFIYFIL